MKTAGIIGGLGPESTVEYYHAIITRFRERTGDGHYPALLINSVDLRRALDLVEAARWSELTRYLVDEIGRLARAGADFGAVSANTPHIVFDELRRESPIPLISIVEATAEAAVERGLKRVGLFGTRFTMQGRFYPDVFARTRVTLVTPETGDQDYIHEKYMNELVKGIFLPDTRQGLLAIARRLQTRHGVEAVILGGTELPLILRETGSAGVPFLDTTRVHVERIVDRILS